QKLKLNVNKRIKTFSLALVIWCFVFVFFKKEDIKIRVPFVSKVSTIKNMDSTIVEGNMGDWIAIHGTSLASIKSMYFNDVEVDLEEVYEEKNVVYVQIPIKLAQEITNKLYVTTSGGTTEFVFTVNSPDL